MADATCKTCPFWWHRAEDGRLVDTACRRHPPRATPMQSGGPGQPVDPYWTVYPAAQPDEWCGEHPARQRDRLATMAMQAIVGNFREAADAAGQAPQVAEDAYRIADAMLAERKRGGGA